jgi:outer membrane lipoprotein-sorting protein
MKPSNLLELLYTARNRFSSIQITWQYMVKMDLMNEVHQKWASRFPFSSVAMLTSKNLKDEEETSREWITRNKVWWQKPTCWRIERHQDNGIQTEILCDGCWWFYTSSLKKLITNIEPQEKSPGLRIRRIRRLEREVIPNIEDAIRDVPIVDPSFLLAIHDMQPEEKVMHVGREAVRVRSYPRKGREYSWEPVFWSGADEYEFLMDRERGILLRYSAIYGGQEYAVAEVEDVIFDELIPEKVFSFTPPSNTLIEVKK